MNISYSRILPSVEIVTICHGIQPGTARQRNMIFDQSFVKVSVSVGGAVGCNQQSGTVKIRCVDRGRLNLNRPLGKAASAQAPQPLHRSSSMYTIFLFIYEFS